jgi:ribosomal protein S18 acetylase RimI-like enzyme
MAMNKEGSELVIRKMQKKDCAEAGKFCRNTMKWMHEKYLKGVYPKEAAEFDANMKSGAQLAKRLNDRQMFSFVALSDGTISGIVLGMTYGKSGLAKVNWIAVDPKHQHEGIGIRLMMATEEYLRGKGCHKIFLNTLPPLIPAIRLYMKFGLLPEAYLRKHWWGTDFIVMSKWIGDYSKRS